MCFRQISNIFPGEVLNEEFLKPLQIEPHEYDELFPYYIKNPEVRCRNAFCYIDVRDLGQIIDLCLKKDDLGYQVFNAGNHHKGGIITSKELAEQLFPVCQIPVNWVMKPKRRPE